MAIKEEAATTNNEGGEHEENQEEVTPKENENQEEEKPEETGEEEKPAEEEEKPAKEEAANPEEFKLEDLTQPENASISKEAVKEIFDFSKEKGLSKEVTQAIIQRENDAVGQFKDQQEAKKDEIAEGWLQAIKDDKELGGDDEKIKETHVLVSKVVDKFASEKLKQALDETKLGDHPEFVRMLKNIGKAMTPNQLIIEGDQGEGKTEKTTEETLYDNTQEE